MDEILLQNNKKMPRLGFGTDYIPEGDSIYNAVTWAIEAGYRLIDNADNYYNENGLGRAVNDCIDKDIVKREDLFITNKVPDWKQGYQSTIDCCKNSLKRTGLEYFDLYLIHSPHREIFEWQAPVLDTWRALEYLYEQGLVKAIGVSNFEIRHLNHILKNAKIKPMVNQIEVHPMHRQKHVVRFCQERNIVVEAWGTLNQGRIFKNQIFEEISKKYKISIAHVAILWSLRKGLVPLVRSIHKERIFDNFNIPDIEISEDDIMRLDALNNGEFSNWHHDGIKPIRMIPETMLYSANNTNAFYDKAYKLFGFIPIFRKKRESNRITRYSIFGIPILKIDTKALTQCGK